MVKTKIYPNKGSFEARVTDKEFGVIRKVFKKESDAEQFCDEQRQIFEERRARRTLGLSEKPFTPKRVDEAIKSHVDEYLHKKSGGKSTGHNRLLFSELYKFVFEKRIVYCHEVSLEDLEGLQKNLSKRMSESSVNRYFASYGGFFSRCMKKKYIKENPMQYLESLQFTQVDRTTWTVEQYQAFKSHLKGWAIDYFEFLFTTGCRPSEASNLTPSDINFDSGFVKLTTRKGGKVSSRDFPLTADSERVLKRRLELGGQFVFQNERGNKITKDCSGDAARKARSAAGLPDSLVQYGMRHSFVTELCDADLNTLKVQQLVGHKRVQTTQNYVKQLKSLKSAVTNLADFRNKRIG